MDNNKDAVYIQQLRKYCKDNKKWNEIFPVTFIQAIYNAANGNRLDTLLAMYNSIFVEYKGSFATTVAAIDNIVRKKGLIITYFDENNLSWTRRYKLHDTSDINFQNEDNWEGYNFDILIDEIYKAIEYIFNNIDKFPDLKNVLIQQITEVTENIFNNIEDYANLYNIFKNLIKENINNVFNNINDYNEFKNLINTIINNNEYIINDENFFSVSQEQTFTLTTWGKSNFNNFRNAILNGKKVQLYLSSYEDGAEANINVPCEVAVSAKTLIITYVIPDLLKQVKATLTINDNNDNVSCSITNVINLTEVGSGLTIGTTPGTAFEGNRGLQAEKDIDKLQSYTNNGVVVNVESSNNSNGELKVTRCINSGGAIVTSEQYIALPQVSSSKNGLMSANDKTKLDSIFIVKLTGTDLTSVNEDTDINSVKNTNIDITEFSTILDSLNSDKNVKIYINEYNDAVKQTFNINCDIAFNYNSKEIFIQYDIYDVNKRIYASLYEDGDRVSLEILAVKNKYTKFYYIDSNILYNPTKGQSGNLSAAQFSMQQFDELVSDIQKRKDFCVYNTIFASKNSDVKYYRYAINCIVNSNTQLLCNYINPLDNTYIKFTMNKLTTSVQIVVNEKYNIINTVDVLNTVMSGLVLKPTSGNQFETNQRYSSSDTLIQLINKFIQNSGYNDFRIVHSSTTINFVFGITINNSNPIVNVLSFASNLLVGAPVLRIYSKSIDFSEVATLTYAELNNTIKDGSWRSFELDLSNIGSGGSGYTLPIASATTLGGIKIPANGQMSIDKNGNLYPNAATSNSAGIVKPPVGSGLIMNGSSISVALGRKDINLGTLTPGSTINGGHYYIYNDTVIGNMTIGFNLNNNINSWGDPLAIIIVNRKFPGGLYFKGTNINMLTATDDCTKIGAIFIRYFQNGNEDGYFVWAVPKVIQ